jgi:hypothetical protein
MPASLSTLPPLYPPPLQVDLNKMVLPILNPRKATMRLWDTYMMMAPPLSHTPVNSSSLLPARTPTPTHSRKLNSTLPMHTQQAHHTAQRP